MSSRHNNRLCFLSFLSEKALERAMRAINNSMFKRTKLEARPIKIDKNEVISNTLDIPREQVDQSINER